MNWFRVPTHIVLVLEECTALPDMWPWVYAYRKVLIVGLFSLTVTWQSLPTGEAEWRQGGVGWSAWLGWPAWWEETHVYYDGPNCVYRFLCFGFERHGIYDCRKCMSEDVCGGGR